MSVEKKRFECSALPKGWQREEVIRKTGLSAGKVDVCYYSPDGQKYDSKPQLVRAISDSVDLTTFDFSTGKCNTLLARRHKKPRTSQFDYRRVQSRAPPSPDVTDRGPDVALSVPDLSAEMPSHCCVPQCTTNYSRSDLNVSVFTLPKDPGRRRQWLRAIGRQEYSVGKSSVVCIRHFEDGAVLREDRATRGDGSVLAVPRTRLKLCPTALPTLHLGASSVELVQEFRGVRNDASLVPPIRQTASIFKQPVTVYRTQEGKVKADFKHGPQEKPKQLFWEKRLEGLRASDAQGNPLEPMELPRALRPAGPGVTDETLLQSVATALHVLGQPITGQTNLKPGSDKNPAIFINPDQPLIQAVNITDEDIKRQEERVNLARKRLQEAMKEYDP